MIRIRAPHPALLLPALAAALLAVPATAQQAPGRDPVPAELVEGLLGSSQASAILVGRLPAGFSDVAAAPGLRVVGGVERADRGSIAVLASPEPCAQAAAALRARLLAAGWRGPAGAEEPAVQRGFVSSAMQPSSVLCRGGGTALHIEATPRADGGSYLKLYRSEAALGHSPCEARMRSSVAALGMAEGDVPIPALHPPAGSRAFPSGSSSGPGYQELSTHVTTTLGPRELVEHYAAQLRQAGWAAADPAATADVAAQGFRHRDEKGRSWTALLLAYSAPDSRDREVRLRLNEVRAPGN